MSSLLLQPAFIGAAASGSAVAAMAYATFAPRAAVWSPVVWRGPRDGIARVALTFDDGPSPESTGAVLDTLGELGVPAAFFVVGLNASRAGSILRRMDQEGHAIGNHSFDHHHFAVLRAGTYWRDQLARTDAVIESHTGRRPRFFRPPMGFKTPLLVRAARNRGQQLITWTRRALDGVPTTDTEILRRLAGRVHAGDIVAMHDGVEPHGSRSVDATLRALRPLVHALRDRGLTPVRLDALLGLDPYMPAPGKTSTAPS